MSRIQGTPFIQKALSGLTDGQKTALLGLINGGNDSPAFRSLTNPSHAITDADLGVSHVILETKDSVRTGYLVYTESHCVLLAYARNTQSVDMLEIDLGAKEYETVPEELSILELRFELEEEKEALDIVDTVQEAIDEGTITTENAFEIDLDGATSLASTDITDDEFAMLTDPDKECKVVLLNAGAAGANVTLRRTHITAGVSAWFDSDTHIATHWHSEAQNVGGAKKISASRQVIALNEDDPNDADDVLQTIRVGSEMYSVSSVEANPTLAGTESELLGLEVDGVKYRAKETYDTDGVDFEFNEITNVTIDTLDKYASYVRIAGQEITFVVSFNITLQSDAEDTLYLDVGQFTNLPQTISDKLVGTVLDTQNTKAYYVPEDNAYADADLVYFRIENLDIKAQDGDPTMKADISFYCTKEAWDDFATVASSMTGQTITTSNIISVVSQLPVAQQNMFFANLMVNYYTGRDKNVPRPILEINNHFGDGELYIPELLGSYNMPDTQNPQMLASATYIWANAVDNNGNFTFPNIARQTDSYFVNGTAGEAMPLYRNNVELGVPAATRLKKEANGNITLQLQAQNLIAGRTVHVRHVSTFLLTDNLGGVDPILANNSWEVIDEIAKAGVASNYWSVGDTKTDLGTDGTTRAFRIVNIDAQGITFEQVAQESATHVWNPATNTDDNSAYNNYYISDIRNTTLPATLLKYSSALQGVITTTNVKVAKNGNSSTVLTLTDKLFLEAEKEILGIADHSRSSEASELSQFQWYVTHNTASDRIKYRGAQAKFWWLRSPYSGNSSNTCGINYDGSAGYFDARNDYGFAPCFRIGTAQTGGLGPYVPVSTTLADNDWETIKKVCQDGQAANYWALGDTKNIAVSGVGDVPHAIVDMTANRYQYASDNTKYSNVVFQAVPTIGTYTFNAVTNKSPNGDTAFNGWDYSDIRTSMNSGTIYGKYDSGFTALLVQVKTMAAYSGATDTLVYSSDKLFLPAAREVKGKNYTGVQPCEVSAITQEYGYYAQTNDANANRIKYPYSGGSPAYWWTRSPRNEAADYVRFVDASGSMNYFPASDSYGVAPCFAF